MIYAKYCSNHITTTWMRAKLSFHWIWIMMEKLLVNRPWCNSLFSCVTWQGCSFFFHVFPLWNVPFLACFQYYVKCCIKVVCNRKYRADSRLWFSKWETSLQSNDAYHWLGANLESTLKIYDVQYIPRNIQIAHDDLMTFSALLALCVGNPLVILVCRTSNGECW